MGIRVAYGPEDNITQAIEDKAIPSGTIIVTKRDDDNGELLFYDTEEELKRIVYREKFDSIDEVQVYIEKVNMVGKVISIQSDGEYCGYIVQEGNALEPLSNDDFSITVIDGGTSGGL